MSNFEASLEKSLNEFKKKCYKMGRIEFRSHIENSINHLKKVKDDGETLDLSKVSYPFIYAIEEKYKDSVQYVLEYFQLMFRNFSEGIHPNHELTKEVLETVYSINGSLVNSSVNEKIVGLFSVINGCGIDLEKFIHGEDLAGMFKFLFRLQRRVVAHETTSRKCYANICAIFSSYIKRTEITGEIQTAKDVARKSINSILHEYIYAIEEYDIIDIVKVLSNIIVANIESECFYITELCHEFLTKLLESKSSLLGKSGFMDVLRTEINTVIKGLCFSRHEETACRTAKLIVIVWEKFSHDYKSGLYDLIGKGLLSAMNSPFKDVQYRAVLIVNELIPNFQLFIDLFANFDCDETGSYKNICCNLIDRLAKLARPESDGRIHLKSLQSLNSLLQNMRDYYRSNSVQTNDIDTSEQHDISFNEFQRSKSSKNIYDMGLALFSKNEFKGIKYFIEKKLCGESPEEIASFLFDTPSLNQVSVGNVIGGSKENCDKILTAFVNKFNFKGMSFERAFRAFLSKFIIPGEAQMIERIMERFGNKYYNDNPGLFSCPETVYVLAYSALMLHTDAHHPTIKDHMTLEQFIRNNAGIDRKKDLPVEFLTDLYNGITSKKIYVSAYDVDIKTLSSLSVQRRERIYKEQILDELQSDKETHNIVSTDNFISTRTPYIIVMLFSLIYENIIHNAFLQSFESKDEDFDVYDCCIEGFSLAVDLAVICSNIEDKTDYVHGVDMIELIIEHFSTISRLKLFVDDFENIKEKHLTCIEKFFDCLINNNLYLKHWRKTFIEVSNLYKICDIYFKILTLDNSDTLGESSDSLRNRMKNLITAVEKLFKDTNELSDEKIVIFCEDLSSVASSEFNASSHRVNLDNDTSQIDSLFESLRLKFMEHFVEIIKVNTFRDLDVWLKIWSTFSKLLDEVNIGKATLNLLKILSNDRIMTDIFLKNYKEIVSRTKKRKKIRNHTYPSQILGLYNNFFMNTRDYSGTEIPSLLVYYLYNFLHNLYEKYDNRDILLQDGWNTIIDFLNEVSAYEPKIECFEMIFNLFNREIPSVIISSDEIVCKFTVLLCKRYSDDVEEIVMKVIEKLTDMEIEYLKGGNSYTMYTNEDLMTRILSVYGKADNVTIYEGLQRTLMRIFEKILAAQDEKHIYQDSLIENIYEKFFPAIIDKIPDTPDKNLLYSFLDSFLHTFLEGKRSHLYLFPFVFTTLSQFASTRKLDYSRLLQETYTWFINEIRDTVIEKNYIKDLKKFIDKLRSNLTDDTEIISFSNFNLHVVTKYNNDDIYNYCQGVTKAMIDEIKDLKVLRYLRVDYLKSLLHFKKDEEISQAFANVIDFVCSYHESDQNNHLLLQEYLEILHDCESEKIFNRCFNEQKVRFINLINFDNPDVRRILSNVFLKHMNKF